MAAAIELEIKPHQGWQRIDFRELWHYRELLAFLVWRDVKVRYRQTALGGLWAILQPLIAMLIFTGLFASVAKIRTDSVPYSLFVYAGLVPWTFFANAVTLSSNSLIGADQMIRKIYFPRLLVPMGVIVALGLDMLIGFGFIAFLMAYHHWPVTANLVWLPLFMFGTFLAASGLGLALSALNVQYRDVKYVVPFFTQMALFLTPVLYPMRYVPQKIAVYLAFNPMAGMVEGFRYAVLGSPVSWPLVASSLGICMLLFAGGLFVFRRMERTFSDII